MKLKFLLPLLVLTLLSGCSLMPLRGGYGAIKTSSGAGAFVKQSQNPQQETSQKFERITEEIPNGIPLGSVGGVSEVKVLRVTERGETHIGAAQKDTGREIAAKLSSLKGVVIIGVLVFLFGAASFVYPPLKVLVGGSVTTSAVISAAGLALIFLPSLLVGHEILILSVSGGAAGLYWFAHRHGSLQGIVNTLKGK